MGFRDRIQAAIFTNAEKTELTKLTKPPCVSFVSAFPDEYKNIRDDETGHECPDCHHYARPGKSVGYCSGRDDLPLAYGANHPLHKLPADTGKTCEKFRVSNGGF